MWSTPTSAFFGKNKETELNEGDGGNGKQQRMYNTQKR